MTQFELVVQPFLALSRLFRCCCKERLEAVSALAGQVLPCLVIIIYTYTHSHHLRCNRQGPALVVVAVFEHLTSHTLLRVEDARVNSSPPHKYEYEYEYE